MKARRWSSLALVATMSSGFILSALPAAAAETDPVLDALERVALADEDGSRAVLSDLAEPVVSGPDEVARTEHEGITITLPVDPAQGIDLSSDAGSVTVGLPFADAASEAQEIAASVIAYENHNDTTTVPILKDDGSVQITTVIDSSVAPTSYSYPLDIPTGATAELVDGVVAIRSADGSFLAGISPAWATDAAGEAVPTHYVLEGNTLTQIVEHTSDFQYPVVADPWLGNALISTTWVTSYTGYWAVNTGRVRRTPRVRPPIPAPPGRRVGRSVDAGARLPGFGAFTPPLHATRRGVERRSVTVRIELDRPLLDAAVALPPCGIRPPGQARADIGQCRGDDGIGGHEIVAVSRLPVPGGVDRPPHRLHQLLPVGTQRPESPDRVGELLR